MIAQGAYASGGWQTLKASTIASKLRANQDLRILHATLRLRRSLTGRSPDSVREFRRGRMRWGTRVEYAGYHQTGTDRLPRRRPVELTETARRQVVRILQRYIVTGSTSPL